jgi:hypothetical protein
MKQGLLGGKSFSRISTKPRKRKDERGKEWKSTIEGSG